MKRVLSLVLILVMVLSLLPVGALADESMPFTDVTAQDWFYDAVVYVYDNGLMSGDGLRFDPAGITTRGMIVTILHRMTGADEAGGVTFVDVAADAYYADAVAWASENGIVTGYDNGCFGPNDPITREQLAAILYRYAAYLGKDTDVTGDLSAFLDGSTVSGYAQTPMCWAVGSGLISGVTETELAPGGTAARAQVAMILCRFAMDAPEELPEQEADEEEQEVDEEAQLPDTLPEDIAEEDVLIIDGQQYYIGMDADQLPQADEKLPSVYGFTWYVFGTDTYEDFFAAGVSDGRVDALTASGISFSYMDHVCGDQKTGDYAELVTDQHDDDIVHAVLLKVSWVHETYHTERDLAGECKLNFHLTNGFRVYHGLQALRWCEIAEAAALGHSEDMAQQDYFSHDSIDGRKFYERMLEQGLNMYASGENIAASTGVMGCFEVYNGWVNSEEHRTVMLDDYAFLGVGAAYTEESRWATYYTQDFYR